MSDNASKPKFDQTDLGALWKKQGQSQKYLSGIFDLKKLSEAQLQELVKTKQLPVMIFTNKFKQNDNHPDYRIYLSKPKQTKAAAPATAPVSAPAGGHAAAEEQAAAAEEDGIL